MDEITKRIQEARDNHPIRSITINGVKITPHHTGADHIQIELSSGVHQMYMESPEILEIIYTAIRDRWKDLRDPKTGFAPEGLPDIIAPNLWESKRVKYGRSLNDYIEKCEAICNRILKEHGIEKTRLSSIDIPHENILQAKEAIFAEISPLQIEMMELLKGIPTETGALKGITGIL